MNTSPLLDLPAELRNAILEYALQSQASITIWRTISAEAPLLRTCKKIRSEGELLFYAINSFTVYTDLRNWHHLTHWLRHGPPEKPSLLKSLTVHVTLPGLEPTWPVPSRPRTPRPTDAETIRNKRLPPGTPLDAFQGIDFGGREIASVVHISANGGVDTKRHFEAEKPLRTDYWSRILLMYLSFGPAALDAAWAEPTSAGWVKEWCKVDERLEGIVRKRASGAGG